MPQSFHEQVRFILPYSVVRAPTGDVGYLVHDTDIGLPGVAVNDKLWIMVQPTDTLQVLAQPGTTATLWIDLNAPQREPALQLPTR